MTDQASPDAALSDARTATRQAETKAKDYEERWDKQCEALEKAHNEIARQRAELDAAKWREMHYTVKAGDSQLYRHGEAIWLRTHATDSQISAMLKSRDDAVMARSAADREVGTLTGERDELQRQLAELRGALIRWHHADGHADFTDADQALADIAAALEGTQL